MVALDKQVVHLYGKGNASCQYLGRRFLIFVRKYQPFLDIQINDFVNCVDEILLAMNDWNERIWSDIDRGNQRNCRKSCPIVTYSARNSAWTGVRLDPALCSDRSPTSTLNQSTSLFGT